MAVAARSQNSNIVILAARGRKPRYSERLANELGVDICRLWNHSHGAQFSYAGVDEAEADSGDDIVPKEAGSATIK